MILSASQKRAFKASKKTTKRMLKDPPRVRMDKTLTSIVSMASHLGDALSRETTQRAELNTTKAQLEHICTRLRNAKKPINSAVVFEMLGEVGRF